MNSINEMYPLPSYLFSHIHILSLFTRIFENETTKTLIIKYKNKQKYISMLSHFQHSSARDLRFQCNSVARAIANFHSIYF